MTLGQVRTRIDQFNNVLEKVCQKVLIVMAMGTTVIVSIEVLIRFFINASITWSSELAQFLLSWLIFIGASLAYKRSELVAITCFSNMYPKKVQNVVRLTVDAIILLFLLIVICYGGKHLITVMKFDQVSPGLKIHIVWMYLGFYIGMIMMLFYNIGYLARDITPYGPDVGINADHTEEKII